MAAGRTDSDDIRNDQDKVSQNWLQWEKQQYSASSYVTIMSLSIYLTTCAPNRTAATWNVGKLSENTPKEENATSWK